MPSFHLLRFFAVHPVLVGEPTTACAPCNVQLHDPYVSISGDLLNDAGKVGMPEK